MNATVLLVLQALVQYGPEAAQAIVGLLHQTTAPTLDQWNALFAMVKPLYSGATNPPAAPAPAP